MILDFIGCNLSDPVRGQSEEEKPEPAQLRDGLGEGLEGRQTPGMGDSCNPSPPLYLPWFGYVNQQTLLLNELLQAGILEFESRD